MITHVMNIQIHSLITKISRHANVNRTESRATTDGLTDGRTSRGHNALRLLLLTEV